MYRVVAKQKTTAHLGYTEISTTCLIIQCQVVRVFFKLHTPSEKTFLEIIHPSSNSPINQLSSYNTLLEDQVVIGFAKSA